MDLIEKLNELRSNAGKSSGSGGGRKKSGKLKKKPKFVPIKLSKPKKLSGITTSGAKKFKTVSPPKLKGVKHNT